MTYLTPIFDGITGFVGNVTPFIPTLLYGLVVLVVGCILTRVLRDLLVQILHKIHFDMVSDSIGLTKFLKNGGIKKSPSTVIGCLFYALSMIMVFILSMQAFNISLDSRLITLSPDVSLIDQMFAYVPVVVVGAFVLIVGMYLARFVSALMYIAAKNTDMPAPATVARLTKLAIMVYVTIIYLNHIGLFSLFTGEPSLIVKGIVLALALAFGFAGKDIASNYLDVFKKPTHK